MQVLTFICPSPSPSSSNGYLNTPISPGRSSTVINEADTNPHEALKALLSCRLVSRTWCRLASDNAVWRALFLSRWNLDLRRTAESGYAAGTFSRSVRATLGKTWDYDLIDIGAKAKRVLGLSSPAIDAPITSAPLRLDWRVLYQERLELDMRWAGTARTALSEDSHYSPSSTARRMAGIFNNVGTLSPIISGRDSEMITSRPLKTFEPKHMQLSGHTDR